MAVVYVGLDVRLFGDNLPAPEWLAAWVDHLLRAHFDHKLTSDVSVELSESAGEPDEAAP